MKTWFVVVMLACVAGSATALADDAKLDLMLRGENSETPVGKAMLSKSTAAKGGRELLDVLIKSTDADATAAAIEAAGGEVRTVAGDIMIVSVPPAELQNLSDRPEVAFIEASKRLTTKMDTARSHTGVDSAQAGTVTGSNLTGTNVIVGVVDDGLDFDHADFKGSDGKTRIQYLRQRVSTGGFKLCVKSQIDDGDCTIATGGQGTFHGTHVTGIAAGSHATYKGAAPDAGIMFVFNSAQDAETSGSTSDVTTFSGAVIDGVDQIFKGADLVKKAAVVNLSLGTSLGAHDDTSLLEQGLNSLCKGKKGRICVNAAGNENVNTLVSGTAAGGLHADINVSSGTDKGWRFGAINSSISSFGGAIVDIWFNKGDTCTVEARAYKANASSSTTSALVAVGPKVITSDTAASSNTGDDGTASLSLAIAASDANNSRPHAQVTLSKTSSASWADLLTDGSSKGYVVDVVLRASSGTCSGSMWLYPDQTAIVDFLKNIAGNAVSGTSNYTLADGDSNKTMTIPATASGLIAVGSFMQEKPLNSGASRWTDINGKTHNQTDINDEGTGGTVGDVSLFSSLGPTGEVSGSRTKPDIIAPGEPIISALASGASVNATAKVDSSHMKLEGTSMSSPHVAGLIALILQYNNTLTESDMRTLLADGATPVTDISVKATNAAGSGKVNIATSLGATKADTSSFSGTRDVTTDDVDDSGFKSSSDSGSSSSSKGCGQSLVPGLRAEGVLSLVLILSPAGWLFVRRRRGE